MTFRMTQLDANENLHPVPAELMKSVTEALQSFSSGCSAQIYPDPTQTHFRAAIAKLHADANVTPDMVCAGSGSDDILDIIMRILDVDNCIICPPTFAMYAQSATLQNTEVREVKLDRKFDLFYI